MDRQLNIGYNNINYNLRCLSDLHAFHSPIRRALCCCYYYYYIIIIIYLFTST